MFKELLSGLAPVNTLCTEPKNIAYVLGGGGANGAFQPGSLQIIEETGIPFQTSEDHKVLVEGVSVGAINGASWVARGSCKETCRVWRSFKKASEIFEYQNALSFIWKLGMPSSAYKVEPLARLIGRIDEAALIAAATEFVAVATEVPSGHVQYFSTRDPEMEADAKRMLLAITASCAFPGGFPAIPIRYQGEWKTYVDGAFKRLLPIVRPVDEGYDTIVAIRCRSDRTRKKYPLNWLKAIEFGLDLKHDTSEKDEIQFVQTLAKILDHKVNLFVVEPEQLPATLDTTSWHKGDLDHAMKEGRRAATQALAPLADYFK